MENTMIDTPISDGRLRLNSIFLVSLQLSFPTRYSYDMKANKTSLAALGLFILTTTFLGGHNDREDSRFKILVGEDKEGATYAIMDTAADRLIYDGGHNTITLDTVINGTYIFHEDILTEETFWWLVTYNPDDDLLTRAFLDWSNGFKEEDWESLKSRGGGKLYEIESLDIANRTISVRLLNGSLETLDLKGEKYGNYWVDYDVYPNTIITMNNSIHGKVYYKGKFIAEPYITSRSFKGIPDPEIYILAPTGKVRFKTEGDDLVANTAMCMFDSDCGYEVEIRIDSTGQTSLSYVETEPLTSD